jgi:hypothetical protein
VHEDGLRRHVPSAVHLLDGVGHRGVHTLEPQRTSRSGKHASGVQNSEDRPVRTAMGHLRSGDVSHIRGEVERFCYWHPNDEKPLDVVFEARIWGLPEHMGMRDVHASHPDTLHALAALCAKLAALLEEAQTRPNLVRAYFLNPA